MKFQNPNIAVPYFTQDTLGKLVRTHSHFQFNGRVDRRRVRRMIRRVLHALGISAPKFYIDHYIKVFTR